MNNRSLNFAGLLLASLLALTVAHPTLAQAPTPPPGGWHHGNRAANGAATPNPAPATPTSAGPVGATLQMPKNAAGQQFFIVASIDLQKSQLLLKHPTEVTLLVKVDDKTVIQDDSGKPLKLSDLRAGDTVWVNSSTSGGEVTATRVREGQMTVADLHRYYLDYAEIK